MTSMVFETGPNEESQKSQIVVGRGRLTIVKQLLRGRRLLGLEVADLLDEVVDEHGRQNGYAEADPPEGQPVDGVRAGLIGGVVCKGNILVREPLHCRAEQNPGVIRRTQQLSHFGSGFPVKRFLQWKPLSSKSSFTEQSEIQKSFCPKTKLSTFRRISARPYNHVLLRRDVNKANTAVGRRGRNWCL